MEDQNKNPNTPEASDSPSSQQPYMSMFGQRQPKVLQPTDEIVKEVASSNDSYFGVGQLPSVSPPQPPISQPTNTSPPGPTPPLPNTSSIYPEATQGIGASSITPPPPSDTNKSSSTSMSFSDGFSIGTSVFFRQLLAGIVLGLIFFGISSSVLKTGNTMTVSIVSSVYYLFELAVAIYIPYSVLKSNGTEEPFWTALLGGAIQLVLGGIVATLTTLIVFALIIKHGSFSALHGSTSGELAVTILLYIALIVEIYFLTKLAYGLAFMLFAKLPRVLIRIVGVTILVLLIGFIGSHYWSVYRSSSGFQQITSSSQNLKTVKYNNELGGSFSLEFYKNYDHQKVVSSTSTSSTTNAVSPNLQELISNMSIGDKAPITLWIESNSEAKEPYSTASCVAANIQEAFQVKIDYLNQSVPVCGVQSNGQYIIYVMTFHDSANSYIVYIAQNLNFKKILSSQQSADQGLQETGLNNYNSDLQLILSSIKPS